MNSLGQKSGMINQLKALPSVVETKRMFNRFCLLTKNKQIPIKNNAKQAVTNLSILNDNKFSRIYLSIVNFFSVHFNESSLSGI